MAIRIEVTENGKIELFDSVGKSWSEHKSVREAMAAALGILRRETLHMENEQSSSSEISGAAI